MIVRRHWTQDQFFAWAEAQEARYEFDGIQPVAITGWLQRRLRSRRQPDRTSALTAARQRCRPLGPDAGVETVDKAVRYPDALVTCSKFDLDGRTVPSVVMVFEVVGNTPDASRRDRIVKVREYAAVSSIRRYVIVESSSIGLTVMERSSPDQAWQTTVLISRDTLRMPEIDIEIPVAEIYDGLSFEDDNAG